MTIALKAGDLYQSISFRQQVNGSPDGHGNTTKTWNTVYSNVPASIVPYKANEFYAGQQVQTKTYFKIALRYLPNITTDMQIVFGSQLYGIDGIVNVDMRNITLNITCSEINAIG